MYYAALNWSIEPGRDETFWYLAQKNYLTTTHGHYHLSQLKGTDVSA